tara:strand:- start:20 stop:1051 length:1032 start_codon:yes stop_codon:yes gene_type:complete
MSEEQMERQEHSAEEKFFGVKTVIGKKPDDEGRVPDIDVEVVDDRPPEDRRAPAKEARSETKPEAIDDEELEGYSDKVKKRINKLRYQQHEERRQREEAERLREEAIRVAQKYADQSKQYHKIIQEGEQYLVHQIRERAAMSVDQAKNSYRQAYEEGNTDKILEAQEAMIDAQSELKSADYQLNEIKHRPKSQPESFKTAPPAKQPEVHKPPEPSAKALKWSQDNTWFGQEKDMTALAYGVHEKLVRDEGFDPNSDEYFETIDRTMRSRFPDYFGEGDSGSGEASQGEQPSSTSRSPSVVVAPSSRNNGAKPRKVRLSRTQIALAKRLGLTAEQYANQLIKES